MHLDKVTTLLKDKQVDWAVFFRPQEVVMLTGYYPHWNGSVLVSSRNGDHILFVPDLEPSLSGISDNVEVIRYPWATAETDPWLKLINSIENIFGKECTFAINTALNKPAPAGNAGEGSVIPLSFFMDLNKRFTLININPELSQLLSVKTPEQIAKIRTTHRVILPAIAEFFNVRQGDTDSELVARIEAAITRQVGKDIKYARAWASIQSGIDSKDAGRFNKTGTRELKNGDLVFLEMCVCVDGYWGDLTRVTTVGEPTYSQQQHFDIVHGAIQSTLQMAKPGTEVSRLYDAAVTVFNAHGLSHLFTHGLGHGTGFAYHDPGVDITPSGRAILEPGQVITIEPALYGDEIGGGIRIEENIVITENGFDYLSTPQTKIRHIN